MLTRFAAEVNPEYPGKTGKNRVWFGKRTGRAMVVRESVGQHHEVNELFRVTRCYLLTMASAMSCLSGRTRDIAAHQGSPLDSWGRPCPIDGLRRRPAGLVQNIRLTLLGGSGLTSGLLITDWLGRLTIRLQSTAIQRLRKPLPLARARRWYGPWGESRVPTSSYGVDGLETQAGAYPSRGSIGRRRGFDITTCPTCAGEDEACHWLASTSGRR